jgi:hypothetical protein
VSLLNGCFLFPGPEKPVAGEAPSNRVGPAGSRRPLRIGQATRGDVARVLGPPPYATRDGTGVAYTWPVTSGAWVWPLCFAAHPRNGQRTLVLRFDPTTRVLRSYEILKQNEAGPPMWATLHVEPLMSPDMGRAVTPAHPTPPQGRPTQPGPRY